MKRIISIIFFFCLLSFQNAFSKGCDLFINVNGANYAGFNDTIEAILYPGNTVNVTRYMMGCGCTFNDVKWYKNGMLVDTNINYVITDTGYYVSTARITSCTTTLSSFLSIDVHTPDYLTNPYRITSASHYYCQNDTALLSLPSAISYLWSNGSTTQTISVTSDGSYTAVMTDSNGISYSLPEYFVHFSPIPTVDFASSADTLCINSIIHANVNDDWNFVYQWEINNVSLPRFYYSDYAATVTGNYKLVVSSTCGSDSDSIQLAVSEDPVILATKSVFCQGDSDQIVLTNSQYSYQWRQSGVDIPGATDDNYFTDHTGTFTVLATDSNGCTTESNMESVTMDALNISLGPDTMICDSSSLLLSVGNFIQYQWQNSDPSSTFLVSSSGQYSVRVMDYYNCFAADTIVINYNTILPVDLVSDTICCTNSIITLAAPFGLNYYVWSSGVSNRSLTLMSSTADSSYYYLTATDHNGCISTDSILVVFEVCASVNQIENSPFIITFNGHSSKSELKISHTSSDIINIYDLTGKLIYQSALTNDINLYLNEGIYLYNVKNTNGVGQAGKIAIF